MKEKLPPHLLKLAKKAGFCFWEDEHYGPGPDHIDWSSDYTDCLEAFAKLIAEECAKDAEKIAKKHQKVEEVYSAGKKAGALECAEKIRKKFKIKREWE